jgi:hypothetical protein
MLDRVIVYGMLAIVAAVLGLMCGKAYGGGV